jgi:hypothetical protein
MLCCFQDVGIHYRVRQEGAGKAILRFLAHPAVRHCCCARRRCCATQLIAKFLIRQPELSHVGDSNLRETLRFVETPFLNASQSSTRRVKRSLFQKKNRCEVFTKDNISNSKSRRPVPTVSRLRLSGRTRPHGAVDPKPSIVQKNSEIVLVNAVQRGSSQVCRPTGSAEREVAVIAGKMMG